MSKINRIRIMNFNYNSNTIRIDDETFDLNGESTLLSLRNGGGKTVLVQILIGLFVSGSYRNVGDREFKSYFTTNQPAFIMTEWCMDHGQGYFLVGMMVRKCQNPEENNNEDLEMITFTGFYKENCEYTLERLPIVEELNGKKVLKGFHACKKEMEELKKKYREFSYYDMVQPYQRRLYFSKIKEYQINRKEWETIIKKVNLKESGLSELFANARDEKGLVEKWILNAIESKLNQENDRVGEFQNLSYKLIQSYRENGTKLKRRKIIEGYFEDASMINEQIGKYEGAQNALEQHRSKIAVFIQNVDKVLTELEECLFTEKKEIEDLTLNIQKIWHEEISYRIYQYEDERKELLQDRLASEERILQSEYIKREAEKELCRFQCARLYEETVDFEKEVLGLQEQIRILLSRQQNSEEERRKLGSILYWFYYDNVEKCNFDIKENTEFIMQKEKEQQKNSEEIQKEIRSTKEISEKVGALSSTVKAYDQIEERFNRRFSMDFTRNITGEYEDGILVKKEREFEDELIKLNMEVTKLTERILTLKNEEKQWNEEREHYRIKAVQWKEETKRLEEYLEELKAEQVRRKIIMQHLLAPEQEGNQKALILKRLEIKIGELEAARDEYKSRVKLAEKEYENIKQGKVIELPEHILAFLEGQNIEIIYGMLWLKKNGRSVLENQKLIEKNPFLPYCIIVNKADLEKLQNVKTEIYTNFPIPVVLREDLEKILIEKKTAIIPFGNINFFVMFNQHLLNPEELEKLLEEKKTEVCAWKEKIDRKSEEMKQYRSYYTEIENQIFSLERMEEITELKNKKEEEIKEIEKKAEECSQKKKEIVIKQEETVQKTEETKEKHRIARQRKEEYKELISAYEKYIENRRDQERFSRKLKEAEEREKILKEKQKELEERLVSLRNEQRTMQEKRKEYQTEMTIFLSYQEEKRQEVEMDFDIMQVQSRYKAITEGISVPLKDLNESLVKEKIRYDKKQEELKRKNKYQFLEEEYQNIIYSQEQELHLEKNIEKANKEENAAKEANNKLEKNITRLETKLEDIKKQLWEKMGTEDIIDRSQIVHTDFAARKKLIEYEKEKKEQEIQMISERYTAFQSVQAAMAEYSDYKVLEEKQEDKEVLVQMSKIELISYSGTLRKELNQKNKFWETERQETEKLIRNLSKKEGYQEDFFKKGFDNLLALVKNVGDVKLQLDTLVASYDNSLKKLQVDLLSIDKERSNLEELFLEYIRDIDEHMQQIDKNSTINVRGKSLKMLKLRVPEWEEYKELYQKKLQDFVENFVKRGLEALEENENLQELLGKLITTKRLYDEIVGIGNIGIRLYKIEAEREVPISWQEVSANSGGEGFLSAFVILSCLLSYMRRDESDLFATGEEGKVLIMDNPFAQTNAVHLLKPLMDMAKRTNTQLICLSGLGGDSIYNRFDNIYVLNLVNSNIRQGLQYLKSKHLKGEENREMVLSQFRVEQQDLFGWKEENDT